MQAAIGSVPLAMDLLCGALVLSVAVLAILITAPLGAIGILTLTPYETAIIAADVAVKASGVQVGFLDRFTGSVVVAGDVESVETALRAVCDCLERGLGFAVTGITRT